MGLCREVVSGPGGRPSIGLSELVALARTKGKPNEYYAKGWDRLDDEVRRYSCVAAVSSHVAEATLLELMEDDRVVRRIDDLENGIMGELEWVQGLPDWFWKRLAFVYRSSLHVDELRTVCLVAANVAAAFITRRLLVAARAPPFSLCYGDIEANVQQLVDLDDMPIEPASAKLWHMYGAGSTPTKDDVRGAVF